MAIAAISAPKGNVSSINSAIEKLTSEEYIICQITIEIVSRPFVQEQNKLNCYKEYSKKITDTFYTGFDKNRYSASLIEVFKDILEPLRKEGCFAEIICKATILSTRGLDNERTNFQTTHIERRIEGSLTGNALENQFFLTDSALLPPANSDEKE